MSHSGNREHVLPGAEDAMDRFKYEVAEELGLRDEIERLGWGEMTTRQVGRIGGNMVRKMIRYAERGLTRGEMGEQ